MNLLVSLITAGNLLAVIRGLETFGTVGGSGVLVLNLVTPVILASSVIGGVGLEVPLKRENQGTRLQEIIAAMESLEYRGVISQEAMEGLWYPTTSGEVLQYATPDRDTPVTLEKAVNTCTELGARIWDVNPQQGLEFHNIKPDQFYWIKSDQSTIRRYSTSMSEFIADNICTVIKIAPEEESESEDDKKVEIRMIIADNLTGGCQDDQFTSLTLCLRQVKGFPHANSKAYRDSQKEAQSLIREGFAEAQIKKVKTTWERLTWTDSQQEEEIATIITAIKNTLETVKTEDKRAFPDFLSIKNAWNQMTRQIQKPQTPDTKGNQRGQRKKNSGSHGCGQSQ